MADALPRYRRDVGVIGAGAMGAGIAQIAAQAGHRVQLFDTRMGAADAAKAAIGETLATLAAKGKLDARRRRCRGRRASSPCHALGDLRQREARRRGDRRGPRRQARAASRELESRRRARMRSSPSNTSSLSITALAAGMKHPGRVVGMHFFNPAPLMPLVEVVSGLATDAGGRRHDLRDGAGVGQDAGARAVDAGLHRQPLRAAVLCRGAAAAGRARRRSRDARRRDARGGRLPHGAVRADGPDRPRRQPRGDDERLGGVLPRSALHAVGAAARDGRGGLSRPQGRARLLRLRARMRAKPAPRTEAAAAARRRRSRVHGELAHGRRRWSRGSRRRRRRRARRAPIRAFRAGRCTSRAATAARGSRSTDGRTATASRRRAGVRDLVLFDLALDYATCDAPRGRARGHLQRRRVRGGRRRAAGGRHRGVAPRRRRGARRCCAPSRCWRTRRRTPSSQGVASAGDDRPRDAEGRQLSARAARLGRRDRRRRRARRARATSPRTTARTATGMSPLIARRARDRRTLSDG